MRSRVVVGTVLTAFVVTACTSQASPAERSDAGTVSGRMIFMGGPAPGAWPVTPGVVTLRGSSVETAAVDSRGRFQVATGPGTYHVSGTSSEFADAYVCRASHAIVVAPSTTSYVVVGCLIR